MLDRRVAGADETKVLHLIFRTLFTFYNSDKAIHINSRIHEGMFYTVDRISAITAQKCRQTDTA